MVFGGGNWATVGVFHLGVRSTTERADDEGGRASATISAVAKAMTAGAL